MKSVICVTRKTTIGCALALFSVGVCAQDKSVELKFAHWLPGTHSLSKLGFEPWAKAVESASGGTIKVVLFPAQQLGKAADHYDLARDGIADMSWVSPGYQANRFPVFAAAELPFQVSKPGAGSAAIDKWYRNYAATEMKDVRLCFAHAHIGTIHSKKPINDPGQIKGMKIRPSNGTVAQTMTLLGATNVQVSAPESRDAIEKGVADAITFPWSSLLSFNIDKAVKFHTDMRLYAAAFTWIINPSWYGKLNNAQKKVIDDHCNNEWAGKVGAAWGDDEDSGQGKLEKQGHNIVRLTTQQLDAWKKAVEPVTTQWLVSVNKNGANGEQILNGLRQELKTNNAGQ